MKLIKKLRGWGIYQNNAKEREEYGFAISVVHPETMDCYADSGLTPADTDIECETLEQAVSWIENYEDDDGLLYAKYGHDFRIE